MNAFCLIFVGLLQLLLLNGTRDLDDGKRVMCFYVGIPYTPGDVLVPEAINVTLCTHLIYVNGKINNETGAVEPNSAKHAYYENGGKGYYDRIGKLKENNPKLKVLLLVDVCCGKKIPTTSSKRSIFISSTVSILMRHGFDGLHLDPSSPMIEEELLPETYFGLLLMELRAEFDKHGFLLSTILPVEDRLSEVERKLDVITRTCDLITVISIDLGTTEVTRLVSPLPLVKSNIDLYLSKNVPANKILVSLTPMGIPAQLVNLSDSSLGAKTRRPDPDPRLGTSAIISYGRIMKRFGNHTENWVIHRDEESKSPYAVNKDGLWINYDDTTSVAAKCRYAVENNLGGVSMIALDMDDYMENGGEGSFPLTRTAYEIMTKRRESERV